MPNQAMNAKPSTTFRTLLTWALRILLAGLVIAYALWSTYEVGTAVRNLLVADDLAQASHRMFGSARNTPDEPWRDGWGVTYQGAVGVAQGLAQITWVAVALLASLVTNGWLRRTALLGLLAWAGFWTANAAYMLAMANSTAPGLIQTAAMHAGGLIVCVMFAWARWPRMSVGHGL
jgi:hypothetical protein